MTSLPFRLPSGFRFAGVHCGIKSNAAKEDLTLVTCLRPAVAAGVYTQNLMYAAPVALDRERTPSDQIRAIVVNSGNANACTGPRGLDDAREMGRLAAEVCQGTPEQSLVMSTGVIGRFLPMPKIAAGIQQAAASLDGGEASFLAAARGITTTDKSPKIAGRTARIGNVEVQLAGMCKGAGMIGPHLATMLGLVLTDARLTPSTAQSALAAAADESFNCISVEGHTSTNDTVLLVASGTAMEEPLNGTELANFQTQLTAVCIELARQIPADGEGSSHLINIEVRGARDRESARRIAITVANSSLVKAGIAGADPNWGRVVSAAGYAGVPLDPARVCLSINGIEVYRHGMPTAFDAAVASASIRNQHETFLVLDLGEGPASLRFWTSDLTVDYVRFNSEYTT